MDIKQAQKFAYTVNSLMLALVFGLMAIFIVLDVELLVWFSVPTAIVYTALFFFIYKKYLNTYIWITYAWLTLYTALTTLCLGESYGFHLYCFSMIPVVFTVEYMSYKLGRREIKSLLISIIIAVIYLVIISYISIYGPLYDRNERFAPFLHSFNALTVFGYLVFYTNYLIRTIIKSEIMLKEIAHIDRLTNLYNRHYMLERLDSLSEDDSTNTLAMVDIDDFKKINDEYGHNAGDEVLKTVSSRMSEICRGCDISRWGGEEFLILMPLNDNDAAKILENMRRAVSIDPVKYEDSTIKVTLTIGMAMREDGQNIDEWIQVIDDKLYKGKKSGKNKVVR